MTLPTLPPEIWFEILRYIPRSAQRNLVGVNRVLFEHVLDYLYEEIRFIDDDRWTSSLFERIQ